MGNVIFHRNMFILLGCFFWAVIFIGCAATPEVKGGGTIIGNPTLPVLPIVPEKPHEDPLQQDASDLLAEASLRRFLWTRFLPVTFMLQKDPFAPILTQIEIARSNLSEVYDQHIQYYILGNLLAGL